MDLGETISRNLRVIRVSLKINQADLAQKAGIATTTLQKIESGVSEPSSKTVEAIANALGMKGFELCNPDIVFKGGGSAKPHKPSLLERIEEPDGALASLALAAFVESTPIRRALALAVLTNKPEFVTLFPAFDQILKDLKSKI